MQKSKKGENIISAFTLQETHYLNPKKFKFMDKLIKLNGAIPVLEKKESGQLSGGFIDVKTETTNGDSHGNEKCSNNGTCYLNTNCLNNQFCSSNVDCIGLKPPPGGIQLIGCYC